MLGSLTLNFGYVGWVLVIANAIIGLIIGRTRQKTRRPRPMPQRQ